MCVRLTTSIYLSMMGNELSCGSYNVLSFLNMMKINKVSRYTGNHALLPVRLVLVVAPQILVHPFLLEDACAVLLLRCLAEFGRMFGLQNISLPTLRNRQQMGI